MSKFLYPIYKLKIDNYKKWWLYHKKAGGGGILSDIIEGFSLTLENSLARKFKIFEILGNSIQDGEPSPENEVPIKSAGENVNLFDKDTMATRIYKYMSGSSSSVRWYDGSDSYSIVIPCEPNKKYTISHSYIQATIFRCGYIKTNDFTGTIDVYGAYLGTTDLSYTIETGDGATYIVFQGNATAMPDIIKSLKIEQGNKATPWSPYGMGSITDKIVNKNLAKFNKINTIDIVDGSATYSSAGTIHFYFDQIKLKAGNYCFYINPQTKGTNSSNQNLANSDGSVVYGTFTFRPSGYSYCDFTLTEDTTLNDLRTYLPSGYAGTLSEISLIKGTHEDISTYINHEEQTYSIYTQQPMRSIGDVRDVFFKNTVDSPYYDENLTLNGWYERHDIQEIVADGVNYKCNYMFPNGRFVLADSNGQEYKVALPVSSSSNLGKILCNHLIPITRIQIEVSNMMGIAISTSSQIWLKLDDATSETNTWTKNSINEYLANNPFVINVALAEPTNLPCTQSQIDILENIPSTFSGQTNVFSIDEVKAYLRVQYYKEA